MVPPQPWFTTKTCTIDFAKEAKLDKNQNRIC